MCQKSHINCHSAQIIQLTSLMHHQFGSLLHASRRNSFLYASPSSQTSMQMGLLHQQIALVNQAETSDGYR